VPAVAEDLVDVAAADERVVAGVALDGVGAVQRGAARRPVVAERDVVADAAEDLVVAVAAFERVVAVLAEEDVLATLAEDTVVAGAAVDLVVGVICADEGVVTGAAVDLERGEAADVDGVVERRSDDGDGEVLWRRRPATPTRR
jgi:hypothetical protein